MNFRIDKWYSSSSNIQIMGTANCSSYTYSFLLTIINTKNFIDHFISGGAWCKELLGNYFIIQMHKTYRLMVHSFLCD